MDVEDLEKDLNRLVSKDRVTPLERLGVNLIKLAPPPDDVRSKGKKPRSKKATNGKSTKEGK